VVAPSPTMDYPVRLLLVIGMVKKVHVVVETHPAIRPFHGTDNNTRPQPLKASLTLAVHHGVERVVVNAMKLHPLAIAQQEEIALLPPVLSRS